MSMLAFVSPVVGVILMAFGATIGILILIFVLVPLLKLAGKLIVGLFRGIGWLISHLFEFIGGMIGDTIRFIGSVVALIVFVPLVLLSVIFGRWSAAGHFGSGFKRELKVGGGCLYRVLLRRPLKLVWLHGLLEGVEQRVPEAMAAAPTSDTPSRRVGQFPGYTIVGSLRPGGSGAKLYVAEPDAETRKRIPRLPERVVIKVFALSEGSELPQIVRESRALEGAKRLGLVFDHSMDANRFYYVMPYHPGDHLGIVARQLHAESGESGLGRAQLARAMSYAGDLVATLEDYHRVGLWHKDVKPENVIVHSGRAHLVDLGLVTPLRSAMTLTTHGTEYFRDPEMVRQALRGVKVHEVNGVKFDVFAAGAVLYFLIENEFPPHGALSRFGRTSPDALKWIVRRAMADYHHRYESAQALLDDLRWVSAASDPYAVRAADLPSMSGRSVVAETIEASAPVPGPAALAAGLAGGAEGARAGSTESSSAGAPAGERRRPLLRMVNWWTGRYSHQAEASAAAMSVAAGAAGAAAAVGPIAGGAVPDAAHGGGGVPPVPAAWNAAASNPGDGASCAAFTPIPRSSTARRPSPAAQRCAARRAAKEARRQAKSHRASTIRGPRERQPTFTVAALSMLAVALVVGGAWVISGGAGRPDAEPIALTAPSGIVSAPAALSPAGRPVLVLLTGDELTSPEGAKEVRRVLDQYRQQGYDIIDQPDLADAGFADLYGEWTRTRSDEADEELEEAMATFDLYGILEISISDRAGSKPRADGSVVYSTRRGADDRRILVPAPIDREGRYLLINDHPTRLDESVSPRIRRALAHLRLRGWRYVEDADLEASVRHLLPPGALAEDAQAISPRLIAHLRSIDLSGAIVLSASHEPGREESVVVRVIDAGVQQDQPEERADGADGAVIEMPEIPVAPAPDVPPAPDTPLAAPGGSTSAAISRGADVASPALPLSFP